jgi:hypothetical protein
MTDAFDAWNLRLLQEFFSIASKGEEVFLATDADTLDEIGPDLGGDAGFMSALRRGAPWSRNPENFVDRALRHVELRKLPRGRPAGYMDPGRLDQAYLPGTPRQFAPTYLPYLAALVRGAGAQTDYYAELRLALGLPSNWGSGDMAKIELAWDDLAEWTRATNGDFGVFTKRVIGGYQRIGVPKSQTLLNRRDAGRLGSLFAELRLTPEQDPFPHERVIQAIHEGHGFSTALKDAAGIESYFPLLRERLSDAFDDWDGGIPVDGSTPDTDSHRRDLQLCLGLGAENRLPWRIRWRVPELSISSQCWLEWNRNEWLIETRESSGGTSSDGEQPAALAALSSTMPLTFSLHAALEDGAADKIADLAFVSKRIRVMVGRPSLTGSWGLYDSILPSTGNAYLLARADAAADLRSYLEREKPSHNLVPMDGLPEGWLLVYLLSQILSDDQRVLPDGAAGHAKPRTIRFEGGVSVRRGGRRLFLPYDLPEIVVDGPGRTELIIKGPPGHLIVERQASPVEANDLGICPSPRFNISERDLGKGGLYQLAAVLDGTEIGKVVIRIQSLSTGAAGDGNEFSLDELGRTQRTSSNGLRGIVRSLDNSLGDIQPLSVDVGELGNERSQAKWRESVPALFLDALSQAGTMGVGRARDLIHRMQAKRGQRSNAWALIGDLRARGHLEVELSLRGHWARIHAVSPSLYELPVDCGGGKVLGVLGSLSINQWEALERPATGFRVFHQEAGGLPTLRILLSAGVDRRVLGERMEMETFGFPGLAIARWAASWSQVYGALRNRCVEAIPRRQGSVEAYSARSGFFTSRNCVGIARPTANEPDLMLYRMEDPDIRDSGHRVCIAAMRDGFAFVHDPSWASWLALQAFGTFLNASYGIADASPWPLTHDAHRRDVWLPARLKLPTVQERALVACHGGPPEEFSLTWDQDGDQIRLVTIGTQVDVAKASSVYEGMAAGKWLRYRWVPEEVIRALRQYAVRQVPGEVP